MLTNKTNIQSGDGAPHESDSVTSQWRGKPTVSSRCNGGTAAEVRGSCRGSGDQTTRARFTFVGWSRRKQRNTKASQTEQKFRNAECNTEAGRQAIKVTQTPPIAVSNAPTTML